MQPSSSAMVAALPSSSYLVLYDGTVPLEKYLSSPDWLEPNQLDLTYFNCLDHDLSASTKFEHWFCGAHDIPGAWCPNCNKPLLRFLDLDALDPRLELPNDGPRHVHLLYCWTCNVTAIGTYEYDGPRRVPTDWFVALADGRPETLHRLGDPSESGSAPFMYQILASGGVRLLQYARGGVQSAFPYADYPSFFPQAKASLVALDIDAEAAFYAENRQEERGRRFFERHLELHVPRHQVGGEPYLVQKDFNLTMRCPLCGKLMPRLAAIGDDCLDERGFTGQLFVQVIYHYCPSCAVVGCFNQAD
jgi:hypothetical protein